MRRQEDLVCLFRSGGDDGRAFSTLRDELEFAIRVLDTRLAVSAEQARRENAEAAAADRDFLKQNTERIAREQASMRDDVRRLSDRQDVMARHIVNSFKAILEDLLLPPEQRFAKTETRFADIAIALADIEHTGEFLGKGGFGVVYAGKYHGNDVAIKTVGMTATLNDRDSKLFKDEVEVMRTLRCDNLVRLIGACLEKDNYAIVMERMRASLYDVLHGGGGADVPIALRTRIARDVAAGMRYLYHHNPPYQHRDLKSANVLLDTYGRAAVSDFGSVRLAMEMASITSDDSQVADTWQWKAPERVRRMPFTEACDIYSFGAILYELSELRVPYTGEDRREVADAMKRADRDFQLNFESLACPFVALGKACTSFEPTDRKSFGECHEALHGMCEDDTIVCVIDKRTGRVSALSSSRLPSSPHASSRLSSSSRPSVSVESLVTSTSPPCYDGACVTPPPSSTVITATALYTYTGQACCACIALANRVPRSIGPPLARHAQRAQELSFAAGDAIQVLTKYDSGWWDGIHVKSGRRGWLSSSFMAEVAPKPSTPPPPPPPPLRGVCTHTFYGHSGPVRAVAVTPDGSRVVTGSEDKTARVWSLSTGQCFVSLQGHAGSVNGVAVTPDGSKLVTGSNDETARVWLPLTGQYERSLKSHGAWVFHWVLAVAVTPDGSKMVTGQCDKTARVWSLTTGQCCLTLQGHAGHVCAVAVTPDGSQVVTGSHDKTARVWSLSSGQCGSIMKGHFAEVRAVAMTPDGSQVVTGSDDKTVRMWDRTTGRCMRTLGGHTGSVLTVAVTPDGRTIVTGSKDKSARVWDRATGACKHTFHHDGTVWAVAVTPDGRSIVTGSSDNAARVWPL